MPKHSQWQPISRLPLIAAHIDDMLMAAQEQYKTMLPAKLEPHLLDDYALSRVKEVFTAQLEDLRLFEVQLNIWNREPLTTLQRIGTECLMSQMKKLHEQLTMILALARELGQGTICIIYAEE